VYQFLAAAVILSNVVIYAVVLGRRRRA
jgi:hypothetical protein